MMCKTAESTFLISASFFLFLHESCQPSALPAISPASHQLCLDCNCLFIYLLLFTTTINNALYAVYCHLKQFDIVSYKRSIDLFVDYRYRGITMDSDPITAVLLSILDPINIRPNYQTSSQRYCYQCWPHSHDYRYRGITMNWDPITAVLLSVLTSSPWLPLPWCLF